MCLFETKAIWEGITSDDATFLTTPKVDESNGSKKGAPKSANGIKRTTQDDIVAVLGITLGLFQCFVSNMYFHRAKSIGDWFFLFLHTVLVSGLLWVNGSFLREKHFDSQRGRRHLKIAGLLLLLFSYMSYKNYAEYAVKAGTVSSKDSGHRSKISCLSCYLHLLSFFQINGAMLSEVSNAKRGVYFLANDYVLDNTIAFLNSFRHFNPTIPLALIPYDGLEGSEELLALTYKYDFSVFYNPELLQSLDQLAPLFPFGGVDMDKVHHYRKMAMWDGPFEEFVYIDIDAVVLDSIDFAFPLLRHADVFTASSGLREYVWLDSVDTSGVLSKEQIEYGANTGFIVSSKKFATADELLQKTLRDVDFLEKHIVREVIEQGTLNYLFATSDKRYSSLNDLAYKQKVPEKVMLERNGMSPLGEDGFVMTDDYRLRNTVDPEHPVFFLHWTGDKKCDKFPGISSSCAIWEHWRNV